MKKLLAIALASVIAAPAFAAETPEDKANAEGSQQVQGGSAKAGGPGGPATLLTPGRIAGSTAVVAGAAALLNDDGGSNGGSTGSSSTGGSTSSPTAGN